MKRVRFASPIQEDGLLVIEKCIGVDEEGEPIRVILEPHKEASMTEHECAYLMSEWYDLGVFNFTATLDYISKMNRIRDEAIELTLLNQEEV